MSGVIILFAFTLSLVINFIEKMLKEQDAPVTDTEQPNEELAWNKAE